ncbi:MAG: butyryl-CoA:acetate CoA-transferase [Firmicutes bacterium]|nr:butyryl-CoA:acetate CoA-transferase [Bacillota bacterium]
MRGTERFYKAADIAVQYDKKLITSDQAAGMVKSGDRVHIGTFGVISRNFEAALAKRKDELDEVIIHSSLWSYDDTYETNKVDPSGEVFKIWSTHMSQKDRRVKTAGHAWYIPILYSDNNQMWSQDNKDKVNMTVITTGPMDAHGNFNLGVTVGETRGTIQAADIVIVEVNENMPRCNGIENYINIAEVDYITHSTNYPIAELPVREAGGADAKIAELIMPLIEDGSCLQLGVGAMPNHLGKLLAKSDLKNLSVHTEMLVDAFVDLYEEGKITGQKNVLPGKMVYTFALGTKRLYDFLDNNQMCVGAPVDYVNNPNIISQNDKVISINAALQVDIYGQVSSESIGFSHISGQGGQMNFVEGAYHSKGGKSFICTASTKTKDGKTESLILPYMPPGGIVSCPRYAPQYIVTEYGIAMLKGLNTWERAEALINIAHPDYREDLIKDAEKQGIWCNTSKLL